VASLNPMPHFCGDSNWTLISTPTNCTTMPQYPCLNCTEMSDDELPCNNTSLWRNVNFKLEDNDRWIETLMLGIGNCSEVVNQTESVFMVVETMGFFSVDDKNDTWPENFVVDCAGSSSSKRIVTRPDMGTTSSSVTKFNSHWMHVFFTPIKFNVTLLSNQTNIYYSNITDYYYYSNVTDFDYYSNITEGFCMPIRDYWQNEILGCPCNNTWDTNGYYNSSAMSFMGGREIIPSQCPNDTCSETLFLNDTMKFANVRINVTECKNGTVMKTVEITRRSHNRDIGYTYGVEDIEYVFGMSEKKSRINKRSSDDTMNTPMAGNDYSGSNSLSVSTIIMMMFVFLLSNIHSSFSL